MSFEARVWCENGDLLGYATVEGCTFTVDEADEDSGYLWFGGEPSEFEYSSDAERYAKEWATSYMEHWQEQCDCGTSDCGALTLHGILTQYCRDGYTVDE